MQLDLIVTSPIAAARPLVPIEAAIVILDRNEDEILHAIEDGSMGWAWDIAAPGVARREIRIWRESLAALTARRREEPLTMDEVLARILPPSDIRSPQLQRVLSCSQTHLSHLIESGMFEVLVEPRAASGPNSWTLLSRDSVARFLRSRRVC